MSADRQQTRSKEQSSAKTRLLGFGNPRLIAVCDNEMVPNLVTGAPA
jgi:hypothetical protein